MIHFPIFSVNQKKKKQKKKKKKKEEAFDVLCNRALVQWNTYSDYHKNKSQNFRKDRYIEDIERHKIKKTKRERESHLHCV